MIEVKHKMIKNYGIKTLNFYSFEYQEDNKTMEIYLDFRDEVLYLTPSMIKKWNKPYEDVEISYNEKVKILQNIRECLLKRRRTEQVVIELPENTLKLL